MIFVAVGTQKFQFDRLIRSVDQLVAESGEEAFGQIGYSTYLPEHFPYKQFLPKEEFLEMIRKSGMVITHSGVATIIEALQANKPVIVMPRLEHFGEHVDDHQVQIAESFDENGLVLMCTDENKLADLVDQARSKKFNKYISQRQLMISTIETYLKEA